MNMNATEKQLYRLSLLIRDGRLEMSEDRLNNLTRKEASKMITETSMQNEATDFQRKRIQELVNEGKMPRLPYNRWKALSASEADRLIDKAVKVESNTLQPLTPMQRGVLKTMHDQGLISVTSDDLNRLTSQDYDKLYGMGMTVLDERGPDAMVEFAEKYMKDAEPATDKQREEITRLVKGNYLTPVSNAKWPSLTKAEARKMIFKGINTKNRTVSR